MIEAAGCDRFRLEIYGERGTLWLRSERGPLAVYAPDWLGRDGWFYPGLEQAPFGQRQHRHWVNGLGEPNVRATTASAGLRGLLVAEAIERSASRGGQPEALAEEAGVLSAGERRVALLSFAHYHANFWAEAFNAEAGIEARRRLGRRPGARRGRRAAFQHRFRGRSG